MKVINSTYSIILEKTQTKKEKFSTVFFYPQRSFYMFNCSSFWLEEQPNARDLWCLILRSISLNGSLVILRKTSYLIRTLLFLLSHGRPASSIQRRVATSAPSSKQSRCSTAECAESCGPHTGNPIPVLMLFWCGFSNSAFPSARRSDSRDNEADYSCQCFSQHIWQAVRDHISHRWRSEGGREQSSRNRPTKQNANMRF